MEIATRSTGRVFIGPAETGAEQSVAALPGFAYATSAPSNAGMEGVRGNLERTPMNQAYFSQANFQRNINI